MANRPSTGSPVSNSMRLTASVWPLDAKLVSSHTFWAKWAEWGLLWLGSNIEKMVHLVLFLGR